MNNSEFITPVDALDRMPLADLVRIHLTLATSGGKMPTAIDTFFSRRMYHPTTADSQVANPRALEAIRAIVTYEICVALKISPTKAQATAYAQYSQAWEDFKNNSIPDHQVRS